MTRAILVSAAVIGALAWACSPDPGPFFKPPAYPENGAAFRQGRLGLLTPSLRKEDELIAFRLLSGLMVADDELPSGAGSAGSGQDVWRQARAASGVGAPIYIQEYRSRQTRGSFDYYRNCLDDAFVTAAATLADRRQHYASKRAVTDWVNAQDRVFASCSSTKPDYPEPAATGSAALERADREYQIAAAHFYAEDLEDAERRFRAIAADSKSPWQHVGGYMVGRALLREVSLQSNTAAAPLARQQFEKISNDGAAGKLADSARGLLQHLDALGHPATVMADLSQRLVLPHAGPEALADAVRQSAFILRAGSFQPALSQPNLPDAFDWVRTLENGGSHAIEQWQARRTLPWLVVALVHATGKDAAAQELIQQAGRLRPNSPAFGTASYNAIRLRLERGETERPRQQLEALLATTKDQPDSLVNGWRAERMRLATDFEDWLRWAPRKPIGASALANNDSESDSAVLAQDALFVLNYGAPLSRWTQAAHSRNLPPWSASQIALAAWTRAFLLNNLDAVREVAPVVAKAHPDWAASLVPPRGGEAGAWKFHAALLIAQHREFDPLEPLDYRKHGAWLWHSWWCPVAARESVLMQGDISWRLPVVYTPPDSVISAPERDTAEGELKALTAAGSAQAFLAPIIFDWAASHPDDALVPQALHRLVMVVRYGCGPGRDTANKPVSKRAFELLHSRYQKSEWTAKTPYWFE